jgi:HEAT repeat protein
LKKALQHKNPRVRAAAQRILDRYAQARRRLEPILTDFVRKQSDLLLSPSAEVRRSAAERLGDTQAAGAPAIPRLAQLVLTDPNSEVRSGSASTLGRIGAAAVPTLVKLAKSDQPSVCKDALSGLMTARAVARTEGVVACLKGLRSHPDPEVRDYSARVLEMILAEPEAAGR